MELPRVATKVGQLFGGALPIYRAMRSRARYVHHIVTTDSKVLSRELINSTSSSPLIARIALHERAFIEMQGIRLTHGELIANTEDLLKEILERVDSEARGAIEQCLVEIRSLEVFTPYELRGVYRTFSRYLDIGALGIESLELRKQAKEDLTRILRRAQTGINSLSSLNDRETILKEINRLVTDLAAANIDPEDGIINYFSRLDSYKTSFFLAHELGHITYRRGSIEWPSFTPLSYYSKDNPGEEDYCENFALYMNGYPLFYLFAKVSEEWKAKFGIFQRVAKPKNYLPNLAVAYYLSQHAEIVLEERFGILSVLKEHGPNFAARAERLSRSHKFIKNRIKVEEEINVDEHRKVVATLEEMCKARDLPMIRHRGHLLEEYNLNPQVIFIIGVLGRIPEPVAMAIDNGDGALIDIMVFPRISGSKAWSTLYIVTPDGHSTMDVKTWPFDLFTLKFKFWAPMSERCIKESIAASRIPQRERTLYYSKFEIEFGIEILEADHRGFSTGQLSELSSILRLFPQKAIAHIRYIKRIVDSDIRIEKGVLYLDDLSASCFSRAKHFAYLFSYLLARDICCSLIERRDKKFFEFLRSGGWRKEAGVAIPEILMRIYEGEPKERYYVTGLSNDSFLIDDRENNIFFDFASFLYFRACFPERLAEITKEKPLVARRLEIFDEIFL